MNEPLYSVWEMIITFWLGMGFLYAVLMILDGINKLPPKDPPGWQG